MSYERERDDRERRRFDRDTPPGTGSHGTLGKVTTAGTTAAGKFLKWNPVTITGTEAEGGAATLTVDTTTTRVGELVRGSASQNDILLFRWADWRWVTDKGGVKCGWIWNFNACNFPNGQPVPKVPSVLVEAKQAGVTIDSATTIGRVTAIGCASGSCGTGYTNGTFSDGTFTGGGGSGATFRYTISGGVVQNTMVILTQGTGYTSTPTPVFPSAGAGTGLAPLVTMAHDARLVVASGTYDVTITPPAGSHFPARTLTGQVLNCPTGGGDVGHVAVNLGVGTGAVQSGYHCCACCAYPMPDVVRSSGPLGAIVLYMAAVDGATGNTGWTGPGGTIFYLDSGQVGYTYDPLDGSCDPGGNALTNYAIHCFSGGIFGGISMQVSTHEDCCTTRVFAPGGGGGAGVLIGMTGPCWPFDMTTPVLPVTHTQTPPACPGTITIPGGGVAYEWTE